MIEITVKCYGNEYELRFSDESEIVDFARELKKIAYLVGYGEKTVKGIFKKEV